MEKTRICVAVGEALIYSEKPDPRALVSFLTNQQKYLSEISRHKESPDDVLLLYLIERELALFKNAESGVLYSVDLKTGRVKTKQKTFYSQYQRDWDHTRDGGSLVIYTFKVGNNECDIVSYSSDPAKEVLYIDKLVNKIEKLLNTLDLRGYEFEVEFNPPYGELYKDGSDHLAIVFDPDNPLEFMIDGKYNACEIVIFYFDGLKLSRIEFYATTEDSAYHSDELNYRETSLFELAKGIIRKK